MRAKTSLVHSGCELFLDTERKCACKEDLQIQQKLFATSVELSVQRSTSHLHGLQTTHRCQKITAQLENPRSQLAWTLTVDIDVVLLVYASLSSRFGLAA